MKGKLLYHWRSEDKKLEDLVGIKHDENLFRTALKDFCGRRTRMRLKTGEEIDAILVASDSCVLAVKAIFQGTSLTANLSLVPQEQIVSVGIENGEKQEVEN